MVVVAVMMMLGPGLGPCPATSGGEGVILSGCGRALRIVPEAS